MNKGYLGIGIIVLGSLALLIINVITNYSTGGEVDYYLVKETSEAAMTDALDESFMATHGIPRMDKQVFWNHLLEDLQIMLMIQENMILAFMDLMKFHQKLVLKLIH